MLDTNVVVSALLWDGAPKRLMHGCRSQPIPLFTSVAIVAELTEALSRSKFNGKVLASRLSIHELVDFYLDLTSMVVPAATLRIAPDPDDDVVIGTALAAKADLLVTGDRALLSVETFDGGRIVSVSDCLRRCGLIG